MEYAWKREESIVIVRVKIRGDIAQAIDNYGRETYDIRDLSNFHLEEKQIMNLRS